MRFECNHRRLRRRDGVLVLLALSRSYDRIQAIQTQIHVPAKEYQTIPDAVQLWSVQRWYHETRGKTLSSMWNLIIRLVNSRPTSRHIPIRCSRHPSPLSFFSSPGSLHFRADSRVPPSCCSPVVTAELIPVLQSQ